MKIELLGAIAIPVGHRVTVRYYVKKSKGLFGGANEERHQTQPQIEDLTNGVVYSYNWLYDFIGQSKDEDGNTSSAYPLKMSDTLSQGVTEERAITGTIKACRIVQWLEIGHLAGTATPQTELTIEPEAGYRT